LNDQGRPNPEPEQRTGLVLQSRSNGSRYGWAAGIVTMCTVLSWFLLPYVKLANIAMLYLLAVAVVAARLGRGPAVFSSIASVAAFDFFLVPPYFTFAVADSQYHVTFAVMFIVALIISSLTAQIQQQARAAMQREQRTAMLTEEAKIAQRLADTEKTRNALLSSVSHDLRTPLAAISGAASSLRDDEHRLSDDAKRELLDTVNDEASRLSRLVSNLLEITKLESGAAHVKKELCPLEEVIGSALSRFERALSERPVTTVLPADLPLIPMDVLLMEQVFINLLENIIKYTPPSSGVEISATVDGTNVRIEVADRGPGISVGDERKIFDKFFRSERQKGMTGAGLGLAICRAVMDAHGGEISASNRDNGGTAFRVSLPLASEGSSARSMQKADSR
jgi:two-component system, OmpR family, sensor histidine kinase KdpD